MSIRKTNDCVNILSSDGAHAPRPYQRKTQLPSTEMNNVKGEREYPLPPSAANDPEKSSSLFTAFDGRTDTGCSTGLNERIDNGDGCT